MTLIFSSNTALFALEPIQWDHHQEKYTLGSYIEILEDKGASLTFDTIIAPDMQHNWVPSQTPTPSFGYTKSAYWARFKIQNIQDNDNKFILEIAYPLLDSIELYFVEDGHLKNSQKSGDLVPFQQRNNKYRTFVIVFLAAINVYLAGIKRARFFLIAWIPLLLSLIFISLDSMGVIKSSFFTYHSVEIGTALEVLILSLALADRFNIIKKEREAALEQQLTQTQKLASLGMTLQKFVPGEFLKCLNKGDITNIKLGDNIQKNMTVLFSDIRSFTQLSEKMTPEDNFNYLNSYLKRISPIIRKNGGFVDKYIGDSIMALFADSADDALRAAVAMKSELGLYNEERIQTGRAPVNTGIGIHSGSLMLGMIGEEERMDGTVISDAVNLASRIEGLTKRYDAHILISIDTFSSISHLTDLKYRTIDYIKVQGREKSVAVMEILNGDISDSTLKKIETISDFERGMNSLVMEDFENAILYIQKVIDHNPSDAAARLILERARDFLKNGKPEGWDGSISINTK